MLLVQYDFNFHKIFSMFSLSLVFSVVIKITTFVMQHVDEAFANCKCSIFI